MRQRSLHWWVDYDGREKAKYSYVGKKIVRFWIITIKKWFCIILQIDLVYRRMRIWVLPKSLRYWNGEQVKTSSRALLTLLLQCLDRFQTQNRRLMKVSRRRSQRTMQRRRKRMRRLRKPKKRQKRKRKISYFKYIVSCLFWMLRVKSPCSNWKERSTKVEGKACWKSFALRYPYYYY